MKESAKKKEAKKVVSNKQEDQKQERDQNNFGTQTISKKCQQT